MADSYPLLRMEDCVDNVGTANFVSKLDSLKGYWQVPLMDHVISAFLTPDHFLQYIVMAFGMCKRTSYVPMAGKLHTVFGKCEKLQCISGQFDIIYYGVSTCRHWPKYLAVLPKPHSPSI